MFKHLHRAIAICVQDKKWVLPKVVPTFFILTLGVIFFQSCKPLELLGKRKEESQQPPTFEANPSAEVAMSPADKAGFYRWLSKEMYEQVMGKPVTSASQIDGWANVLSQRGSIEGVYNGMVHSVEYASLEKGKADGKAVSFFTQEIAIVSNPILPDSHPSIKENVEKYSKLAAGASLYSLKRALGEKILAESIQRKNDKEQLAIWYSALATRWARMDIPFGLERRNNKDEIYHLQWAKESNLGLIQWELLNRAHRILNSLGGVKINPAGK